MDIIILCQEWLISMEPLAFCVELTIITHCVVRKKTKKKSLKREKLDSRRCGRGFLNSGRGFLISGRGRG